MMNQNLKLKAQVSEAGGYYSRVCGIYIPKYWRADVVEGLPEQPHYSHIQFYGMGDTRDEAISELVRNLKQSKMSGRLKIEN